MTELLAPAGNMEALKAAISNGCDAVYLGMQKFGARAYSDNFSIETLKEAVEYAHLRNVKIYVTMNTIVFEDEISDMHEQLRQLDDICVDGIIVQDLAVFNYAAANFPEMEVHCSTQMGIDDLDGTLLMKELGADRVVLAREADIDKVKAIRKAAKIPVEIFVHGALCVSYSGNCLMSGLIGYRSGNRGRCVGSCRKMYELIDVKSGRSFGSRYFLSAKDLNTIDYIEDLKGIDSLKIEGRMKEPAYVANVVSVYRKALDEGADDADREALQKTFNRTYTRGYLFGEDPGDISNTSRPNNFGYEIGTIKRSFKGMYEISLHHRLNQNDIIRIDHNDEDINLSVVKLYNKEGKLINKADRSCFIKIKEKLSPGDVVYKTKDYYFYKSLEEGRDREFRRFPLDLKVYAYPGAALVIDAEGLGEHYLYESSEILSEAAKNPATREQVLKQLSKLNDTVFTLRDMEFEEYNAFIPAKLLNHARREIVQELYNAKLAGFRTGAGRSSAGIRGGGNVINPQASDSKTDEQPLQPYLTAAVMTQEQYDACRECGIENIYFDNIIRRNQNTYSDREGELLIGGYGGIYRYRNTNPFVTDYSLNAVNAESCRALYEMGAKRVTLSYELNKNQLYDLIEAYRSANGSNPALEMIVYGRAPLMFTRYCPLKTAGLCGRCRDGRYVLRDEYGEFPLISHEDCATTILNGKILNLLDEMPFIEGVEAFRLNFTTENAAEVKRVAGMARRKLDGTLDESVFSRRTDTRGHFNKEIM